MSTESRPSVHTQRERCRVCRRFTQHEVSIEIRTENDSSINAEYSREPYRVTVCTECGEETAARMNHAHLDR